MEAGGISNKRALALRPVPDGATAGVLRLPEGLLEVAGLQLESEVEVRRVLDRDGADDTVVTTLPAGELTSAGFFAEVEDQSAQVFVITPPL